IVDSEIMAHHSAAPALPVVQQQSSAGARGKWRYRNIVEDSEASDAESEPEEFPQHQIDVDPSYLQLEDINSFDFVPQLPELTKSGLELQRQLIRLFPPLPNVGVDWGNSPSSIYFAPQFPGVPRRQLEVQQQRPNNAFVSNSTAGRAQKGQPPRRLDSIATELLAQSFKFSHRSPPAPAFNSVGRLARDSPIIMADDSATQQATLPPTNPRAKKITLSDFDRTDILCILTPTTPAAYQALELVAATAEHHILQYYKKHPTSESTTSTDQMVEDSKVTAKPRTKPSLDIALRMSSMIISPAFGFVFGRDQARSDLLISTVARVSGRHFRIYVNPSGSLMCQDTSTNGTHVDSQFLRKKCLPTDFGDQMTLHNGSVIEIQVDENMESMRFIVQVPDRSGVSVLYGSKLDQYIDFMEQMKRRRQAEQDRKDNGFPLDAIPAPLPQFGRPLRGDKLSARANRALVAGTEPYNHGMLWNGGDAYHVTAVLGKGAFATVYKLARRADGELFAAKEIEKKAFAKGGVLDRRVDQELNIIKQLQHDNIVRYIEHHDTTECLYILMELVPQGDLQTVLQTQGLISEFQGQSVASQMCEALKYLHDRNITHRDIKPDNILIQSSSPDVFKLSDFGLSKVVEDNETFLKSFCEIASRNQGDEGPRVEGPLRHSVFSISKMVVALTMTSSIKPKPKQPYTAAVDTWSLAAVLYHLLCGEPPYTGSTQDYGARILDSMMNQPVDYGKLLRVGVSRDAIDFISKMLVIDPSMRMSDDDCLGHPFVMADKKPKEISEESEDLELQTQAAARPSDRTIRDDARTEENSQSNFERLASQLSINNEGNAEDLYDLEGLSSEYLEDIGELIEDVGQSERKTHVQRGLDPVSDPSFDEYVEQFPPYSQVQAAQQRQGNNLFGQISPAALRSSGALGREARRALEIASQGRAELSADECHYAGSSQISATDFPNTQNLPAPTHPRHNVVFGQAAPSLLGAESMVDKLHMDSTMVDVADLDNDKQPSTSKIPGADERISQAGKHHSTRSDDDLYAATPPRSRRRLDGPSSDLRESKRIRIDDTQLDPGTTDSAIKHAGTTNTTSMLHQQPAITGDGSTEQNTSNIAAAVPTKQTTNQQDLTSATMAPASTSSSSSTTKAESIAAPAPTTLPHPTTFLASTAPT
ncbi:MAG: hypothetical protein Q9224_004676, partial [Gallowayella concinna]